MKNLFFLLAFSLSLFAEDNIIGFWKSLNENTGLTQCVFAIYSHEDVCYGRIICTYDNDGKMKESIYKPAERAPGVVGNPFYCGLDIVYNLYDYGSSFKGKIIDPEKGNVYNSEVWREGKNLIVRGKVLFFGKSMTWYPATPADFPKGFKLPDASKFVPSIPQVN